MRDGPTDEVLSGSARWFPVASAWLDGNLLADQLPIISGSVKADKAQQVPDSLSFVVPEETGGVSWVPQDAYGALARFGQYIDLSIGVISPATGETWLTRIGLFPIQNWEHDEVARTVTVECSGLLQLPSDARFRVPEVPRSDGTFGSEIARLMVDGVPVAVSDDLTDRAVTTSFQWDEDRLGAIYDLADAWPARILMDQNGTCQVLPALPDEPDPVLTFKDGDRGTIIRSPRNDTRDQVYNVVVTRSADTDDPNRAPVWAFSEVPGGPLSPDRYGEVVRFYSTPLVSTLDQCQAAGDKILADSIRGAQQRVVSMVPDPRVELDDAVLLIRTKRVSSIVAGDRTVTEEYDFTESGWVLSYEIPLTHDGGDMSVTVGVV